MLQVPNNGDNILNWARQATREINSNILHNGVGIRVLRSPQGTNLSITSVKKTTSAVDGSFNMPFDVLPGEEVLDGGGVTQQRKFYIKTNGAESNLLYSIDEETKRINPLNHTMYEVPLTVALPIIQSDNEEVEKKPRIVYIVVVLEYSDSESESEDDEGRYFPMDYTFDFATDEELKEEDVLSDDKGFQKIPIAYIQAVRKLDEEEEDEGGDDEGGDSNEGVSGLSRDGEGGGEGTNEEEEDDEESGGPTDGAYRTSFVQNNTEYVLVQLYHGDIHLFWKGPSKLSTCSVGEVEGGEGGTFSVNLEEWDGSTETVRVCACDLACTSYIPAGTKIIAHPIETRYIGE